MSEPRASFFFEIRAASARALAAPLGAALLALAACNGTAVVTLTSTPSQDTFLAYRVGLTSVELESAGGKSGLKVLAAGTTVDLAALTDVSEVLGAAAVAKGSYTGAVITLDYGSAQIVYDDGSLNGVALTAVGANGQALGRIQLTVNLDPGDSFSVASNRMAQLAMNFSLAASNTVNLSAKTVTVAPLIAASAMPIDAKPVRIRGPLVSVAGAASRPRRRPSFVMGVMPFNGTAAGSGNLAIVTGDETTYEIDGIASTGGAGGSQLGGLGSGALAVAYGTLVTADAATTTTVNGVASTTTSSNVSFTASQVLAGSSVQGGGLDRVSGIVAGRSGNTLLVEDGTLLGNDGVEVFIGGTAIVNLDAGTAVTVFGQGAADFNTPEQISVGSAIEAFGVAASPSPGNVTLDASAGRVRLGHTTASGLVTAQGSGTLVLNLQSLGGRAAGALDFTGSGAVPGRYVVGTANLDLANSTVGAPVIATGLTGSFGVAPPAFTASSLLDPTTIRAGLMIDWGGGTGAPFVTFDSSAIDLDVRNSSIGARHHIQIGAQSIDLTGLSSDPLIVPDPAASNIVFAIGHAASSTVETFDTYAAFIAQVQTELSGAVLATGMTAQGVYTASTFSFTATSITLTLDD